MTVTALDIVEVSQVLALYCHVLDAQAWERLDEIFTHDATFDMSAVTWSGLAGTAVSGLANIRSALRADRFTTPVLAPGLHA